MTRYIAAPVYIISGWVCCTKRRLSIRARLGTALPTKKTAANHGMGFISRESRVSSHLKQSLVAQLIRRHHSAHSMKRHPLKDLALPFSTFFVLEDRHLHASL